MLWMLNGWFQGMGYPPCAGSFRTGFHPRIGDQNVVLERLALVGSGGRADLVRYLLELTKQNSTDLGDWRICFFVPAGIAFFTAACCLAIARYARIGRLAGNCGHPRAATSGESSQSPADFDRFYGSASSPTNTFGLFRPPIFLCTPSAMAYSIGATMLKEFKGIELQDAAWMMAGFEFAGLAGGSSLAG